MDFDNFCSFFECHSILAEKQRTKQTNYSSLSLSASLDTQDTLKDGIIVEWKKFWQEIPVWRKEKETLPECILLNSDHKNRRLPNLICKKIGRISFNKVFPDMY